MARKPRSWYPGAAYHITARGNRHSTLFHDTRDFQTYMGLIARCKKDFLFTLHTYCLMSNHIHFLLETSNEPPGQIIKFIHTRYAIYYNKRYDLNGHVFQGRYHSRVINSANYFLKASKYIHLNPVEAGITAQPENYFWSSYAGYKNKSQLTDIVEADRILSYFEEPQKENYCDYVEKQAEDTEELTQNA